MALKHEVFDLSDKDERKRFNELLKEIEPDQIVTLELIQRKYDVDNSLSSNVEAHIVYEIKV